MRSATCSWPGDLRDESAAVDENERIEIVEAPLAELDRLIADCADAKTVIGLQLLKERLFGGDGAPLH